MIMFGVHIAARGLLLPNECILYVLCVNVICFRHNVQQQKHCPNIVFMFQTLEIKALNSNEIRRSVPESEDCCKPFSKSKETCNTK